MTWLSNGIACDGEDCAEFYRGPTFPSAMAARTLSKAVLAGWEHTGRPRDEVRLHLCPASARQGRRSEKIDR